MNYNNNNDTLSTIENIEESIENIQYLYQSTILFKDDYQQEYQQDDIFNDIYEMKRLKEIRRKERLKRRAEREKRRKLRLLEKKRLKLEERKKKDAHKLIQKDKRREARRNKRKLDKERKKKQAQLLKDQQSSNHLLYKKAKLDSAYDYTIDEYIEPYIEPSSSEDDFDEDDAYFNSLKGFLYHYTPNTPNTPNNTKVKVNDVDTHVRRNILQQSYPISTYVNKLTNPFENNSLAEFEKEFGYNNNQIIYTTTIPRIGRNNRILIDIERIKLDTDNNIE